MKETPILKRIMRRCSRGAARLFRNSRGRYKTQAGHWIRYGLGNPGGSDLIGWCQVVITREHIGMTIAQFLAIEVKQLGEDATDEQAQFGKMVSDAGGLFGVAHSPEEAESIIKESIIKSVDNTYHIE